MSQIVHKIGEVVWVGKVKCVETPSPLRVRNCSSYCVIRSMGICNRIACASEERSDGKVVHYELVLEKE